ncbi:hypothetical protein WME79_06345 [Sorangium sp. So ce726]|uniref:hypothetical protein n=1 Tax=Sorangium sp. So ce726 TaxID=3133319 RepID=UPI003F5EF1E6
MSDEDLKKYLPTEETFRRVADRAASDENMRRALARVKEAPPVVADRLGPAARAALARPAVHRKEPRRPSRWRLLGWIAGAAAAVTAPALLIYWLFVPRDAPSGPVEATATPAAAVPLLSSSALAPGAPLVSPSAPAPTPVAETPGVPAESSAASSATAVTVPPALSSAAPTPSGAASTIARRAPARGANTVAAPSDPGQRMPPPRASAAAPATSMPGPFAGPPRY